MILQLSLTAFLCYTALLESAKLIQLYPCHFYSITLCIPIPRVGNMFYQI